VPVDIAVLCLLPQIVDAEWTGVIVDDECCAGHDDGSCAGS
jgi:hypothetical protein